jgi:hypothetical protein
MVFPIPLPTTRSNANEGYHSPHFRGLVYRRLRRAPPRRGSSTEVLIKVEPDYDKIFKDFGTRLSAMTELVILVSRWAANWWFLAIVPLGMDAGIIFALRQLPPERRWITTAWALLVFIGTVLVAVIAVVVLHLCLLELTSM